MKLCSPTDGLFLLAESREHAMHVGGLQLFRPPAGAGADFAKQTHAALMECQEVAPIFRQHPGTVLGGITNLGWQADREVDLDYHVRRSALPTPGRVRELLELTSRLHASPLDRHKPLWETHLIEGLKDGRFAIYTKIHHALVDGVSGLKLLQQGLSRDPHGVVRAPWSPMDNGDDALRPSRAAQVRGLLGSLAELGPSTLTLARAALLEQRLTLPGRAPRTMLNVPIGGARRFAAQSWPLERVKDVKNAAGVSVNDVVLAMCAGALRSYLTDQDALPDSPLTAMVPVSLRADGEAVGGNMVAAVLCNLATDRDDPADRLRIIHTSMRTNRAVLSQLPRAQAMALSMTMLAPAALNALPGVTSAIRPPFNVCISNVPGSREMLYCNGARLDGTYPVSIATNGQALNITLTSSGDSLDFGLIGCRRSVPHLQRLLGHLETSLKDLETAVGL